MARRPNLLVIMSDQHNPHVMGCSGDGLVRTPNLDRLAEGGVRFEHAYCGSPLCVPSRMTFLASLHASEIDVWSNHCVLGSDVPTFAHQLSAAGYDTVLCGRMHFHHADHRHGFAKRLVGDVTPQWPGCAGPKLGDIPLATTGQDRRAVETAGPGRTSYQAYDRAVTDGAIDYLRTHNHESDNPFCMVVGHVLPHCPFVCPKKLYDEYYDKIDIPRLTEEAMDTMHPAMEKWRKVRDIEHPLSDEEIRCARAAYYGMVTMYDAMIGEIMDAVDDSGQADDTAIFYTSDHGDMAGEKEMWWKSSFFEGSASVPLIASWPGKFTQGKVVEQPVSLLDIGPTLIEVAEAESLPISSGESLLAPLTGGEAAGDSTREIFSENCGRGGERPSRMIVQWPWKLIHYDGFDMPQLFNLQDDPAEANDRACDPACLEIRDALHDRVCEGWDADRIVLSVERRTAWRESITAWAQATHPPEPDHWLEPEGCNVFPET
jgi:choline-sulfatase